VDAPGDADDVAEPHRRYRVFVGMMGAVATWDLGRVPAAPPPVLCAANKTG
jgi:hypothetical protein